MLRQYVLTTCAGKRLIARALLLHPTIQAVLANGTLAIIAGTTNGYVAEEVLQSLGQAGEFTRVGFRRGLTVAPGARLGPVEFPGDVIIRDGRWLIGKTIYDVAESLKEGDVVLKGANAFDAHGQPAVQIGHSQGGTVLLALSALIGRRAQLIVPVGLEKRVLGNVHELALLCNALGNAGPRLIPIPGSIFTEIDAIKLLSGADATLLAAGGIHGAEGASWLGVSGTQEQLAAADAAIRSVAQEPPCQT